MLVSTRGRYALRVMIDLAQHNDGTLIALRDAKTADELDCAATDVKNALHHLGSITGTDADAAVNEGDVMRVGVLAYLGDNNLGDDFGNAVLLDELRKRLPGIDVVPVLWSIMGCDVVISGCGTLLDEAAQGLVVQKLADGILWM